MLETAEALRLFRAELAARQIEVCLKAPAGREPLAKATLGASPVDNSLARIVIEDSVTGKTLTRDVELRNVPPDGRALAIAVAIDELLRASWAELAVLPLGQATPPKPVAQTIDAALRQRRERLMRAELGASAAFELDEAARRAGADIRAGIWVFHDRAALRTRFGYRTANSVSSTNGAMDADSFLAALGGAAAVWGRRSPWGVEMVGWGRVDRMRLIGIPVEGARGYETALTTWSISAGFSLRWRTAAGTSLFVESVGTWQLTPPRGLDGANSRELSRNPGLELLVGVAWAP